jgi:CRP-like cAMP-binding protein
MTTPQTPKQNGLLASLPSADYKRLAARLELVPMKQGDVVYGDGKSPQYAYFPADCVISKLFVMENGDSTEIAMVGREGIVGIAIFMSGITLPSRAVVQNSGHAYRIRSSAIREEFRRGGPTQDVLLRYTQALITRMAQTTACYRHHSLEQQLCRWLLLYIDRLPSNELHMTQATIAGMLGVRREAVTEAAGRLQGKGAIRYSRGRITVVDRRQLEKCACECYEAVRTELHRLLPGSRLTDRSSEA